MFGQGYDGMEWFELGVWFKTKNSSSGEDESVFRQLGAGMTEIRSYA